MVVTTSHQGGTTIEKFLVLHTAPLESFQEMTNATPEQAKAGMDAWAAWGQNAASENELVPTLIWQ
jgi:hypothetical protein